MERIAKVLARRGIASRRQSEAFILQGRVRLNDQIIQTPAFCVDLDAPLFLDDRPIPKVQETRVWVYYKPLGYVTTHYDPEQRPTVFEKIRNEHKTLPHVISVGRLDLNSEGILLLTNDGAFARFAELPQTGWVRRYHVRVQGVVRASMLNMLLKGITIDGISYGSVEASVLRASRGSNVWIEMELREGKNQEIRKLMAYFGLRVNRLIRISYGPYGLGDLRSGEIREEEWRAREESNS